MGLGSFAYSPQGRVGASVRKACSFSFCSLERFSFNSDLFQFTCNYLTLFGRKKHEFLLLFRFVVKKFVGKYLEALVSRGVTNTNKHVQRAQD